MNDCIRVGIVDDHPIVREGLRTFLHIASDIEVVGEAANGEEALALANTYEPDVMLMDIMMPGAMSGIDAITRIAKRHASIKLLALTSSNEESMAQAALSAGAIGYLSKNVEPDWVLAGIRQAAVGLTVLSEGAWVAIKPQSSSSRVAPSVSPTKEALTPREHEVLVAMAEGLSNKEIGAELGISEKTVKAHVSHILGKLCVYDRTQAVLVAAREGIVRLT